MKPDSDRLVQLKEEIHHFIEKENYIEVMKLAEFFGITMGLNPILLNKFWDGLKTSQNAVQSSLKEDNHQCPDHGSKLLKNDPIALGIIKT
jgi:hypothetical protein